MSDGMYDAYEDLAAESGWAACAGCHEWMDRNEMEDVDGWLYCHPCAQEVMGNE